MGKRLTPEEKAARIKAWEEAKAAKKAQREERKKARLEAYEKAKAERKSRKRELGRAIDRIPVSKKVLEIKALPTYEGHIQEGDRVGYRFLNMLFSGTVIKYRKERNYRIQDDDDVLNIEKARIRGNEFYESYTISCDQEKGVLYPVNRRDILAKWDKDHWVEPK